MSLNNNINNNLYNDCTWEQDDLEIEIVIKNIKNKNLKLNLNKNILYLEFDNKIIFNDRLFNRIEDFNWCIDLNTIYISLSKTDKEEWIRLFENENKIIKEIKKEKINNFSDLDVDSKRVVEEMINEKINK